MTNAQFLISVLFGWICHASYAAMRRMQLEIQHEQIERNRDRYAR